MLSWFKDLFKFFFIHIIIFPRAFKEYRRINWVSKQIKEKGKVEMFLSEWESLIDEEEKKMELIAFIIWSHSLYIDSDEREDVRNEESWRVIVDYFNQYKLDTWFKDEEINRWLNV